MNREILPSDDLRLLSSVFGDLRQRRLLALLRDQSRPMTDRDLAVRLAVREGAASPSAVTDAERQPIRADLHHRCLPLLEEAGFVERHPEGLLATDRFPFEEVGLSLPHVRDPDLPSWDVVAVILARPRRRRVASVLADRDETTSLDELATRVARRESPETPGGDVDAVRIALHHVDLPKLDDVGVLAYDADERAVTPDRALASIRRLPEVGRTVLLNGGPGT